MAEAREVALAQYARQQRIVRRTANRVQALWRQIDRANITASWQALAPQLLDAVSSGQQAAAADADDYVAAVIAAEGGTSRPEGRVKPEAFAGYASDGRPLVSLLYQPVIDWKVRMLAGQSMQDAARGALSSALQITATQVADAGRTAAGASMAGNRTIQGYVRVVQPPACSRCVLLAGKEYGWNKGFQRHPRCDCIHLPTTLLARGRYRHGGFLNPEDYFQSLSQAEQNRIFTAAGAAAIRDGADIAKVVNARRGMYEAADQSGRRVRATREGTTRRGTYFQLELMRALQRGDITSAQTRAFTLTGPRLLPEQIYRQARSRDEAIELLRRYGYLGWSV